MNDFFKQMTLLNSESEKKQNINHSECDVFPSLFRQEFWNLEEDLQLYWGSMYWKGLQAQKLETGQLN